MKNTNRSAKAALAPLFFLFMAPRTLLALDAVDSLKMPLTARATSMGNMPALADSLEGVFYNPAGLGSLDRSGVTLTHSQLAQDTRLDALGAAYPAAPEIGTFGVSLLSLTQGALEARDAQGNPAGSFTAGERVIGLSWAQRFDTPLGGLRAGVTAKHVSQSLAEASAAAQAVDLGLQASPFPHAPLGLGLSIQNLGSRIGLGESSSPLPLAVGGGLQYRLKSLLLQAGVTHRPHAQKTTFSMGAELWVLPTMALRSGFLNMMSEAGSGRGLSGGSALAAMGMGVGWKVLDGRLGLDYALAPGTRELGSAHRVTLNVAFGGQRAPARLAERKPRKEIEEEPRKAKPLPQIERLESPEEYFAQARTLLNAGRFQAASDMIEKAAQFLGPKDRRQVTYFELMGLIAFAQKDVAKAKAAYIEGLQFAARLGLSDSAVSACYEGVGRCLLQQGHVSYALKFLKKAFEVNPTLRIRQLIDQASELEKSDAQAPVKTGKMPS